MTKVTMKPEQKEENLEAISPLKSQGPILVTTNGSASKSRVGPIGAIFAVLFFLALGAGAWLYRQYSGLKEQLGVMQTVNEAVPAASDEGVSLLDKVNQHILLPHDQKPDVSTIENAEDLKKQETFYEYAQNGDALVKFNSLEIIYNPVADVIVNVRTRGQVAGAETRAVQGAVTIDIRNGAGIGGLAGKTAETFKGVKDYIVQNVGNASKTDYGKTMLINLSSKDVTGLEKQFNTQAVKDLPAGESASSADVVLILGKS